MDEIFIAQPSATFPATDARQFYVSVSRGRDAANIYTDDKEALLEHAAELGDRQSALELVTRKTAHIDHLQQLQRSEYGNPTLSRDEKTDLSIHKPTIERDYEPGF